MQDSGVDKKNFALFYEIISTIDRNTGGSAFHGKDLQFFVPVPCYPPFVKIIVVTGNRKKSRAVLDQLSPFGVGGNWNADA